MSQQQGIKNKVDINPTHFTSPILDSSSHRTPSSMYKTAYQQPVELTGDQALQVVGGRHKFQIIAGVIAILTYASSGWISYGLPYLYNKDSKYVKVMCYPVGGGESKLCGLDQACDTSKTQHFEYIHDTSKTLVNWVVSFELGCESKSTLNSLGSSYFGGYLASSVIFMILADFVGRKPIVISGLILHIIINISVLFVRNFAFLFVYIGLMGLRTPMASHINYMALMEQVSEGVRPYFSLTNNGFDGLGNTIVALVYCFLGYWYPWFIADTAAVAILLLFQLFYMQESPRYLMARKKFKRARSVYKFISKVNKKPMFIQPLEGESKYNEEHAVKESENILRSAVQVMEAPPEQNLEQPVQPPKKKVNILDLWRGKPCRDKALLFIFPYCWLIADIVTYGISFSIGELKGNIFYNGMIMGCADLVSTLSLSVVAKTLGRKKAWLLTWTLGFVGSILYDAIPLSEGSIWNYVLLVIARLGAGGSFGMCFLVTSEYFPTVYRGTVFAVCNAMARLGGIISPLFQNWTPYFMTVFGVMSLSALILTFFVKETKGRGMADRIESFAQNQKNPARTEGSLLEKEDEDDDGRSHSDSKTGRNQKATD